MPKLKIDSGQGSVVPGQDTADKEQEKKRLQAEEYSSNLLYKAPKDNKEDLGPNYTY
ncbi:MAG: hypothetical protein LUB61_03305 [Eggerthellaceae bacterium]|nr:hypothetical protein [Eggerthellaceae bacterium]